jgi:hypothetical protein
MLRTVTSKEALRFGIPSLDPTNQPASTAEVLVVSAEDLARWLENVQFRIDPPYRSGDVAVVEADGARL